VLLLSSKRKYCKLVLAVSPIFVWLAFMSLQPHKEERSVLFYVSLATELSLLNVILHSSETQEPVFSPFIHGCCCDATCFLLMLESIPLLTPD
jgi:5-formyltetrahydrofolate cyclo-ligase